MTCHQQDLSTRECSRSGHLFAALNTCVYLIAAAPSSTHIHIHS